MNKALEGVLSKIQKAHKDAFANVKEAGTIRRTFLDSPQLNYVFGGGWGHGRTYEFFGQESGGKSTLATYVGGQIQKKYERPIVVYVDFEYSFDEKYANKIGLNTDENFILLRPIDGEEGLSVIEELIKDAPIGLVIWDSMAATPSRASLDKEVGAADFGATARLFSMAFRRLNPILARNHTSLIVINQERANVGGGKYASPTSSTGGYAIKFYASWRGRIARIDDIKDKGLVTGIVMRARNVKNKIGIPKRDAELNLSFADGFNSDDEYLKFIIDLGIVKQGGAWFTLDSGEKFCGRDKLLEHLKGHPDVFKTFQNTVNAMLCGETILDVKTDDDEDEDEDDDLPMEENNED